MHGVGTLCGELFDGRKKHIGLVEVFVVLAFDNAAVHGVAGSKATKRVAFLAVLFVYCTCYGIAVHVPAYENGNEVDLLRQNYSLYVSRTAKRRRASIR